MSLSLVDANKTIEVEWWKTQHCGNSFPKSL